MIETNDKKFLKQNKKINVYGLFLILYFILL